jgi:ribosomal protein S18 acetylase RimI-like enzyme
MTENSPKLTTTYQILGPSTGLGSVCESILSALPGWFGAESAVHNYSQEVDHLPSWVVQFDDAVAGFMTIKVHNPYAAEILVMGVRPEYHRMGFGRALVQAGESFLREQAIQFMQVKTHSSSRPDEGYARTRAFYYAMGFRPLEELKDFWDQDNPCLQMVKCLR